MSGEHLPWTATLVCPCPAGLLMLVLTVTAGFSVVRPVSSCSRGVG